MCWEGPTLHEIGKNQKGKVSKRKSNLGARSSLILARAGQSRPPVSLVSDLRLHLHQFRCALELPAGGVDVAAAGTADERRDASSREHALKRQHALLRRRRERNFRAGIQRDQVYLGPQTTNQVNHLAGVLNAIVDPAEQDVLEG